MKDWRKEKLDLVSLYVPHGLYVLKKDNSVVQLSYGNFATEISNGSLPLFRPLSQIKEIIKVGDSNKMIRPLDELKNTYGYNYIESYANNKQGYFNPYMVEYGCLSKLISWHFDVFGIDPRT